MICQHFVKIDNEILVLYLLWIVASGKIFVANWIFKVSRLKSFRQEQAFQSQRWTAI